MKQKINLRLTLIAIIAVVATTFSITIVYYNLFQKQVKRDLYINATLLADTELFQSLYMEAEGNPDRIDMDALAELTLDDVRITWISSDGTVLFDNDTDIAGLANHLDRPEIQSALTLGSGESIRRSDTMELNTFYYALKLNDGTILRVSTQARSMSSVFFTVIPVIGIIAALVLSLCILLGHYLTISLLKPISLMSENLDARFDTHVYRELEPFAEKIRSQHEKILEAANMRQDFTASISHELKTPLTAISGYAELIENHMISPEQETHIAERIRHNADRLLSLINDIIKLSELDHKEIPRNMEHVDLYELAESTCKALQINASQNGVTLGCSGSETILNLDKELINELLENLIQNAIRYNSSGGWVQVYVAREDGHGLLMVSDNGIGIPKEHQEHVFERFYRVDKSRSRETGGTGLGLAIVKHIAEIHGAQIQMESDPGKGTIVKVIF